VGGVFAIQTEHFIRVNGYSNMYWGWGAEDDDMAKRLLHVGLRITRPLDTIARYKMFPLVFCAKLLQVVCVRHGKRRYSASYIRYRLLWSSVRRHRRDGLTSLSQLDYSLNDIHEHAHYTHICVDIGRPPPGY
jgi:hypothetical protein